MIDLTPLDVRNKRGDFKKIMRGYDPQEVDVFLEIVADRLEALVRETLQLRERTQTLQNQVEAQTGREQAVQNALVTAQELRAEMQTQAQREADHIVREAEVEARALLAEAESEVRSRLRGVERQLDQGRHALDDLERRRARFIKEFRGLLQREMDVVSVEEGRTPMEDRAIDLDLGASRGGPSAASEAAAVASTVVAADAVVQEQDKAPPEDAPGEADAHEVALDGVHDGHVEPQSAAEVESDPDEEAVDGPDAEGAEALAAVHDEPDVTALGREAPAPEPPVELAVPEVTVDVSDLGPEPDAASAAGPSALASEPSTLELELMAGAEHAGSQAAAQAETDRFQGVPDLETVLAEAGVEEVRPPSEEEIAPPPAPDGPRHDPLIFDPNDDDEKY